MFVFSKVKGHLFSQWQIDGLLCYMAPKQFSETSFIIKTFKTVYLFVFVSSNSIIFIIDFFLFVIERTSAP